MQNSKYKWTFKRWIFYLNQKTIWGYMYNCRDIFFPSQLGFEFFYTLVINPRTYTQSHTPTVVQGGRGRWGNPSPQFLICCSISKRFFLQWKAFDLLCKGKYISWVVALLEVYDVTTHGRHLGRHLGLILSRIGNRLRSVRINCFSCLTSKITQK